MEKKNELYTFTGMQRDLSVSKHPVNFLYDARNIRLTARDKDTLLSITNERGTAETSISILGTYLGHCILNQYLVVFTIQTPPNTQIDRIYRIDLETLEAVELYIGADDDCLHFSLDNPIEAIPSYETGSIQKVYWVDGLNQPRVINIIGKKIDGIETFSFNSKSFDFVRELKLEESVSVQKIVAASGRFASGVIQYAFTYYSKNGQESSIFYTTPLYYISPKDRGAAADEMVDNAFKITITKVDDNFDYLRIYSIHRTSINGTPIVKRVQDIAIEGLSKTSSTNYLIASYTDTGFSGSLIDPTELLYKGGEEISAGTIAQKDGTLFLGDIHNISQRNEEALDGLIRGGVASDVQAANVTIDATTSRKFVPTVVSEGDYQYGNQLTSSTEDGSKTVPCSVFMKEQTYRLGVQFQHKTGKWSKPVFVKDHKFTGQALEGESSDHTYRYIEVPTVKGTISNTLSETLIDNGYRKARAVVVFPAMNDRDVICSGVVAPTLYTDNNRNNNSLYTQSSWFFRTYDNNAIDSSGAVFPEGEGLGENGKTFLPYIGVDNNVPDLPNRAVEIQGVYNEGNQFQIDHSFVTFHSPDLEFDEQLSVFNYQNVAAQRIGEATIEKTLSSIDIQTSTPTISGLGSGFIRKSFNTDVYGIVSGLFYDDFVVEDWGSWGGDSMVLTDLKAQKKSGKWMVYLWNKEGSLNNDINRPATKGTASAILKKKVISNLRYTTPSYDGSSSTISLKTAPQLFSSNELSILKFNWPETVNSEESLKQGLYQGNIDTMLTPDGSYGQYFAFNATRIDSADADTPFEPTTGERWWIAWAREDTIDEKNYYGGLFYWNGNIWTRDTNFGFTGEEGYIGNQYSDLVLKKDSIRIKYKSTPHLVFNGFAGWANGYGVPIVKITQTVQNRFGGYSEDAFRENTWVPCGESVALDGTNGTSFYWEYGDTYYQRYDCLKTYPFSQDDVNQVVEIGSFMLETHVNIDGRYDRNRGQLNNTNMSPINFNLMNPVYSQVDNFFNYKILPSDLYKLDNFPNQITWTKEKHSGEDVDLWTNVTLASTYDMDGSKGKVVSLNTWKDQIFCFQQKGISNILFNSRVQIPTSDGVPIEISNNYKMDGHKYISDGVGCNNKQLIKESPFGIYFIDSVSNNLHHLSDGIKDVSITHNMTSWFKDNVSSLQKLVYDDLHRDLYVISDTDALCFSEVLDQFTSFYDYGGLSLIETHNGKVFGLYNSSLYKMFEGEYNHIFGSPKLWSITFIANGMGNNTSIFDKTFTNLEFRACVDGDGEYIENTGKFTPALPFDYIEVWDEYQRGIANLSVASGHSSMVHNNADNASLNRKFRIWRCDIPRNNAIENDRDTELGIMRKRKPLDRMRNPWLYIKIQKNAETGEDKYLSRTELHNLMTTYYV